MLDSYPDIMSVKQLSAALGIGINTAYKLIHTDQIKTHRIGRKIIIPKFSVINFLEAVRYNELKDDESDGRSPVPKGGNYDR